MQINIDTFLNPSQFNVQGYLYFTPDHIYNIQEQTYTPNSARQPRNNNNKTNIYIQSVAAFTSICSSVDMQITPTISQRRQRTTMRPESEPFGELTKTHITYTYIFHSETAPIIVIHTQLHDAISRCVGVCVWSLTPKIISNTASSERGAGTDGIYTTWVWAILFVSVFVLTSLPRRHDGLPVVSRPW